MPTQPVPSAVSVTHPAWMRSLGTTLMVAFAALLLAGCQAQEPVREPAELPVPSFAKAWGVNLELRNDTFTELFVRGDRIFAYTKKGAVYVVDRKTGLALWSEDVPGAKHKVFPPILLKDYVVIPTTSDLHVYKPGGGSLRTIALDGAITADVVGENTSVYVPVDVAYGGSQVQRFDLLLKHSVPIWRLMAFKGRITASPAIHADVFYMAGSDGQIYAVGAESREPLWPLEGRPTFDARAPVAADVKADDVGVYIPTMGGILYCLNRINGQVKWQYHASGPLTASPTPMGDTVYLRDPNRGMVAINKVEDPDAGKPQYNRNHRWSIGNIKQILAQDDKHTYVLRTDGVIAALDKKTGATQFTAERKDFTVFATNQIDGMIYAISEAGHLVAIRSVQKMGEIGEIVRADAPALQALTRVW